MASADTGRRSAIKTCRWRPLRRTDSRATRRADQGSGGSKDSAPESNSGTKHPENTWFAKSDFLDRDRDVQDEKIQKVDCLAARRGMRRVGEISGMSQSRRSLRLPTRCFFDCHTLHRAKPGQTARAPGLQIRWA